MSGSQAPGDDFLDSIDWEHLFDSTPEDLNVKVDPSLRSDILCDPSLTESSNPSPDSFTLSVDEIEQLLMNDDKDGSDAADLDLQCHDFPNDFLSDILLDSPVDCNGSGEVVDVLSGKNLNEKNDADDGGGGIDDPISKKRKRQLRNRDAAVRSRERKKTYVRDLELKSKYFEGECKRLGMLLQCYLAENQALRISLQNSKAFDASMTKQESAVLLLESLLLGSLLWFLSIIMCLLVLPLLMEAVPLEIVGNKNRGGLKAATSKSFFGVLVCRSFMMGKRCKASRSRMKLPISFPSLAL